MREAFPHALSILNQAYEILFEFYYQGNFEKKVESYYFQKLSEHNPQINYQVLTEKESRTDLISLINAARTTARFAKAFDEN